MTMELTKMESILYKQNCLFSLFIGVLLGNIQISFT